MVSSLKSTKDVAQKMFKCLVAHRNDFQSLSTQLIIKCSWLDLHKMQICAHLHIALIHVASTCYCNNTSPPTCVSIRRLLLVDLPLYNWHLSASFPDVRPSPERETTTTSHK